MELRYNEVERARGIYERYVRCLPEVKSWVRYAKFEMKSGDVARARTVYERSVQELEGEANMVSMSNHASGDSAVLLLSGLRDVRVGCRQPHSLGANAVLSTVVVMRLQEELFMKFADFEEKVKEVERARAIYRYALDHIPKAQVPAARPPATVLPSPRQGVPVLCLLQSWVVPAL